MTLKVILVLWMSSSSYVTTLNFPNKEACLNAVYEIGQQQREFNAIRSVCITVPSSMNTEDR